MADCSCIHSNEPVPDYMQLTSVLGRALKQIHNHKCNHHCADGGPWIETFALMIVKLRLKDSKNHYLV